MTAKMLQFLKFPKLSQFIVVQLVYHILWLVDCVTPGASQVVGSSTSTHPRSREGEKPPLVEEQDETTPGLHSALCLRRLFLSGRRLMSVGQDADSKGGLSQFRAGSHRVSQAGCGW